VIVLFFFVIVALSPILSMLDSSVPLLILIKHFHFFFSEIGKINSKLTKLITWSFRFHPNLGPMSSKATSTFHLHFHPNRSTRQSDPPFPRKVLFHSSESTRWVRQNGKYLHCSTWNRNEVQSWLRLVHFSWFPPSSSAQRTCHKIHQYI